MANPVDKAQGKQIHDEISSIHTQDVEYKGHKYSLEIKNSDSTKIKKTATETLNKMSDDELETRDETLEDREIKGPAPRQEDSDLSEFEDPDFESMTDEEIQSHFAKLTESTPESVAEILS